MAEQRACKDCQRPSARIKAGRCPRCRNRNRAVELDQPTPPFLLGGPVTRFMAKVNRHGPVPPTRPELGRCWLWNKARTADGYGLFRVSSTRVVSAHRFAWSMNASVEVPQGMHVDHLCHDPDVCIDGADCPHRGCVNPAHLAALTPAENWARSGSPSAVNARKTFCDGEFGPHDLTVAGNVRHRADRPARECVPCARERTRRSMAAARAAGRRRKAHVGASPVVVALPAARLDDRVSV